MAQGSISAALVFLLLSLAVGYLWNLQGYFKIKEMPWKSKITGKDLLFAIGLAFAVMAFIGPAVAILLLSLIYKTQITHQAMLASMGELYQAIVSFTMLLFLIVQFLCLSSGKTAIALRGEEFYSKYRLIKDVINAIKTWILSVLAVAFVSQTSLALLQLLGYKTKIEQVAVQNLQGSAGDPQLFMVLAFAIVFAAPIYEEIVFRGYLQGWLKGRVGRAGAVVITSLVFALVHYAPEQGIGNVSIIASLFTLSCFLGFLYERQQSLIAAILLHGIFNFVTAATIWSGLTQS